jgi:5'-nucleotidase
MRILVTNDDGFHSPGIEACLRIAQELSSDVWMVAPEYDQSGVAHSLSLSDPLRLRKIDERRFAVKGTPTDCVIMAVRHILADMKIGLVLSGVNKGQNIAEDVTYSGTVAGAMEGTILGIPAVALSQCYTPATRDNPSYAVAEKYGPNLIRRLLKTGMPEGVLVNVNFPACKPEEVVGVAITTQGKRDPELLRIEQRFDGRHNPYYWIGFSRKQYELPNGSDMQAIAQKRISVTPLRIDMTDEPFLTELAQVFAAPKK